MAQDANNLLTKYNINVKGAGEPVDVEFRKRQNKVALVFTGVHTVDAMSEASAKLAEALPERLKDSVSYGVTGGEFTVSMPVGTYEQLTGQNFNRGMVPEV
jgi:hypothetical protein